MAREFARRGADVVLLARRWERLEALALEVRARGRRALTIRCDVTSDDDLEKAVRGSARGVRPHRLGDRQRRLWSRWCGPQAFNRRLPPSIRYQRLRCVADCSGNSRSADREPRQSRDHGQRHELPRPSGQLAVLDEQTRGACPRGFFEGGDGQVRCRRDAVGAWFRRFRRSDRSTIRDNTTRRRVTRSRSG